ncbi:hypothetical protein O6R05_06625 [Peptoniphilus equinus]|uniref:Uncharacterized protein n=1 Tax=Peptoniphilus equinus TaxID=3016343 RepID=A0ABY7QSA4_9FIRM|nr:hypothetical protein [Peptoniphilus equinus]WBW49670.1 hypothetical protein O6R05_06625 [Peptoniphilus equinus]
MTTKTKVRLIFWASVLANAVCFYFVVTRQLNFLKPWGASIPLMALRYYVFLCPAWIYSESRLDADIYLHRYKYIAPLAASMLLQCLLSYYLPLVQDSLQ